MKSSPEELAFSRGVLVALGHVAGQFEDVMYDEIMTACDPRLIVEAAQESAFDLKHLRKMGWVTKGGRLKRRR